MSGHDRYLNLEYFNLIGPIEQTNKVQASTKYIIQSNITKNNKPCKTQSFHTREESTKCKTAGFFNFNHKHRGQYVTCSKTKTTG
ncbi:hypothetical protein HanIR_Chr08g0350441 [Helianthus annuus]|nr:hypothetical protein HanIR_Chr08g0350441 [Helianthus annuus]